MKVFLPLIVGHAEICEAATGAAQVNSVSTISKQGVVYRPRSGTRSPPGVEHLALALAYAWSYFAVKIAIAAEARE